MGDKINSNLLDCAKYIHINYNFGHEDNREKIGRRFFLNHVGKYFRENPINRILSYHYARLPFNCSREVRKLCN